MKKTVAAAAALLAVAAFLCFFLAASACRQTLVLYNTETGDVIRTFSVSEGSEFSVSFVHSVNLSPVTDVFVVKNGRLYADRTIYSAFGAGVQSTLEPGQTLSYDENGSMVVSGFNTVFPEVKYIVGTVYDHVLVIGDETVSLTELCGKNAHIAFKLK